MSIFGYLRLYDCAIVLQQQDCVESNALSRHIPLEVSPTCFLHRGRGRDARSGGSNRYYYLHTRCSAEMSAYIRHRSEGTAMDKNATILMHRSSGCVTLVSRKTCLHD